MLAISARILPISKSRPRPLISNSPTSLSCYCLAFPIQSYKYQRGFAIYANGKGASGDEANGVKESGGEQEELKRDRRPVFNLRWRDILDPDPDNLVAVGLTGLLAWASVQVLWQLFFISIAILLAALKYSFIAALLLFILITLL